jgi:hypothetical protein
MAHFKDRFMLYHRAKKKSAIFFRFKMAAEKPVFAFLRVTFERVPENFFLSKIWIELFLMKIISLQRKPSDFFPRSYLRKTKSFANFFQIFFLTGAAVSAKSPK